METKSTHFIFGDEEIVISSDLQPIMSFLAEIEKEIDVVLHPIEKEYSDICDFARFLYKKLKENSIHIEYTFTESPQTMFNKLRADRPLRSKMIVLFAYLETLYCLCIAYRHKTSSESRIRKLAMNQNNTESFLKEFCINPENTWVKNNLERAQNITASEVRRLRNSLTHFFSVGTKLSISDEEVAQKSRKLEKAMNYESIFISPKDLHEIISGAVRLILKEWSDDSFSSLNANSNKFKEKILCVKEVVISSGAVSVKNNEINI